MTEKKQMVIVSPENFERIKKGEMTKEELLGIKKAVDTVIKMRKVRVFMSPEDFEDKSKEEMQDSLNKYIETGALPPTTTLDDVGIWESREEPHTKAFFVDVDSLDL